MTAARTLLVANRGEIAVRVLRTARRLGLRTVAVHSEADRGAPHVRLADTAVALGPTPAADSYLRADLVLKAALETGADAVHPGYGFLSENAGFARECEAAGIAFVGPTPAQIDLFGAKHTARAAAEAAGVPLLAGTGLLDGLDHALAEAERIGYPVMLKATAGGGGIGMRACADAAALAEAWDSVRRTAGSGFGSTDVFLERMVTGARHVEVQVFGFGDGRVLALGDRDCTLQRRNQKVCEEAPAPALPDAVRERITEAAVGLAASVSYRSVGTVEYVYDAAREEAAFLEVNTRLQVEHGVTEAVYGVDLVEWMLRLALRGADELPREAPAPRGHAVQARVYAEDPDAGDRPSAGRLTHVSFPAHTLGGDPTDGTAPRVDTWVETGTEVTAAYDPLLAKVIEHGPDRAAAWARLSAALDGTRVQGVATNLGVLRAVCERPDVAAAAHTTATLAEVTDPSPRVRVLSAGTRTTVQEWPGRTGLWHVGVPPSGPMDALSFRLGNGALGNPEGAPGLECVLDGPELLFTAARRVCVTGAPAAVDVDGAPVPQWLPVDVPAGGTLRVGSVDGAGLRVYVLFEGGLDVAPVLGSAATFDLGGFGGYTGGPLQPGDVLRPAPPASGAAPPDTAGVPPERRPAIGHAWHVGVLEGPHAAPEFLTEQDVADFYAAEFSVHFNSSRTGVRLTGPKPRWARPDGGEAGLHPSNIHDTAYTVGAVDYTGDLPILLGPDGPSLGGFVCPATVATGERWKLGQLRPGDTVRFVPISETAAEAVRARPAAVPRADRAALSDGGVLARAEATDTRPEVTYRRGGDDNLLVEYGPMRLDLGLRMRVHALAEQIELERPAGIVDVTPGIRSLQIHTDPDVLPVSRLLGLAREAEERIAPTSDLTVPSRTVHLPLSWDDPATREAIERYMSGVRDDAPWCPWNIEFIRRVNGLESVDDVYRTVFDAQYLVLGLGDVYLGAPVATPLDPRHRLVTTKYNPARTWTPQNAVGIGGAYLCVYGMEGPGGYQFVGRTVQVWSTWRQDGPFDPGSPSLLRFFDRISWYPVGADELLEMRAEMTAGRLDVAIEDGEFSLREHERFLAANAAGIEAFAARQGAAFAAERAAWEAAGEFDPRPEPVPAPERARVTPPPGGHVVESPLTATVWRVGAVPGETVAADQELVSLEAMKTEVPMRARGAGEIVEVLVKPGDQVAPGDALAVVGPPR